MSGQPIRVLLVPSSYAPNLGGVEELTARLATALERHGDRVMVVTNRWPAEVRSTEVVGGIDVRRFPMELPARSISSVARFVGGFARSTVGLARVMRSFRPDVVHVQCVSTNGFYAGLAARVFRVPLVVTTQGELTMDAGGIYQKSTLLPRVMAHLLRTADAVTACSAQTLREAEQMFDIPTGRRGSVVFNGVELAEFVDVRESGGPTDEPYVFALGRHVREKGFDVLIRAMAMLDPQLSVRLVLAGDGERRSELEALAITEGVADRVVFVGRTDRPATARWFVGSRCFVLPSRHEPFGIVNVEAMASGAPVVATRVGGVPEIVEHERTALLVAPEDPAALAAAIERVLRDPELAARLSAAGRAAAEGFDWTAIAGQYRDIYRRVLASRR